MSRNSTVNTTIGAFVINNEAIYPWTVHVFVPNPSGGKKLKTKFKAQFKHLSSERRAVLLDEFRAQLDARATENNPQDDDQAVSAKEALSFESMMLKEVLVGFSGIKTPSGDEFEYNDENLDKLVKNSWARDALTAAFLVSLKGRSEEGN
jgi:hypothetical protein